MAVKQLSAGGLSGTCFGQSATDLIAFYGATPIAQKAAAAQAVITDASGGTANAATGVAAITAIYNQTILANAIATLTVAMNEHRAVMVSLGLMKGAA